MNGEQLSLLALNMTPNMGRALAEKMKSIAGGYEGIFKLRRKELSLIPRIKEQTIRYIISDQWKQDLDKEMDLIDRNNWEILFKQSNQYPNLLNHCVDKPLLLYKKGHFNFDERLYISIVGTRNADHRGRKLCLDLIGYWAKKGVSCCIVSGLAEGIDGFAHEASLECNVPTVAVLGHGLQKVYPGHHSKLAERISENGALLSEFNTLAPTLPINFVRRNRIVAGISEATIIVQSNEKGGALITAGIANSYDREVFAFPGNVGDKLFKGCHKLIKNNQAILVEHGQDVLDYLPSQFGQPIHLVKSMDFPEISDHERLILNELKKTSLNIDELSLKLNFEVDQMLSLLLELELKGVIQKKGLQYEIK